MFGKTDTLVSFYQNIVRHTRLHLHISVSFMLHFWVTCTYEIVDIFLFSVLSKADSTVFFPSPIGRRK